jgi:haloalkane dehalogenase
MGRSAHPDIDYRFADHIRYVDSFISTLALKNMTLVLHDWGCALGFDYARRHEANVRGLAFMEPILEPIAAWESFPEAWRDVFKAFRTPEVGWDLIVKQNIFVEKIIPGAVVRPLTEAEMAHYRAPYEDPANRKALWQWPNEIPIEGKPTDVAETVAAYRLWLTRTPLPKLLLHANPGGLVSAKQINWCKANLKNFSDADIGPGIHYLQEDNPHGIGEAISRWTATA